MEINKIVFTGGPCAGKTTIINKVKEYLISQNYKVIIVPETATILKTAGINFNLVNSVIDFQNYILKMQITNEKIAEEAALNNKQVIILYDRGILDNKAYCGDYTNFDSIMNNENISEIEALDNYDLVFDLISLAVCNPDKYTQKNNIQREETIEEAKEVDIKTSHAWTGSRNLKIINSNISLEEEFSIIMKEIMNLINHKTTKINKIHYLDNKENDFTAFNDNNSRMMKIQEIRLRSFKDNVNYILHKRTYKNESSYIFTIYKKDGDKQIVYLSKKISLHDYLELISKYNYEEINYYNQLSFIENKQEYIIKFYDNDTILEYEENKLNDKFIVPAGIKFKEPEKQLLKK